MSEFSNYRKEKRREKKNNSEFKLAESKIIDEIEVLLTEHLNEGIREHIFEVDLKFVQYVIEVIDSQPLSDKYIITQISPTMFSCKLKEIEI